ncbi:MAG: hypothetical protein F4X57_09730 [Chloroflexi bacterium]|nr:hypothetical protein [Chloroflexota bacterium]
MCIQTTIQSKIAELTNNGESIAVFLADTLQGQSDPAIKVCHRLDAARILTKYGIPQPDNITKFPSPSMEEGQDGGEENPTHPVSPVNSAPTLRDIIAYPVARYIRDRTGNGEILIDTLCRIMNGGDHQPDPFTGRPQQTVKPRERLAAAKELLRRAFAEHNPPQANPVRPELVEGQNIPSIDVGSDSLNSDLAKLVRDRTNNGIESAELLIRIAENDTEEGDWQPAHRLSAAKELLHRAYDLNYDAVTWDHIDAYNRTKDADPREPIDIESARIEDTRAKLIREFSEAYDAGNEEAMRNVEDKFNAYNARVNEGEDPDEALRHAELGPNDPDPDIDYYNTPLSEEEQAKFYREVVQIQDDSECDSDNRSIANAIHIPKLTIPLNNRSP